MYREPQKCTKREGGEPKGKNRFRTKLTRIRNQKNLDYGEEKQKRSEMGEEDLFFRGQEENVHKCITRLEKL